ncbi:MAG: peptidylprolyl isomerase, FKBP-type [Nocardioides sp.]|nr:peptidylprolyl isomerase, FKBP-type [Nocardioides sp.]
MLRRLRRPALLLLPVVLLASLTACGSDNGGSSSTYEGLDAVTITGAFGKAPDVKWKGEMTASTTAVKTLVKGDGVPVKTGDKILTNVWLGNGYTQQKALSTYDSQPQALTLDDKLSKPFAQALENQTIGSRVALTASAADLFGETGNPQLQIGNKDAVLVILDLMEIYTPPKPVDVPKSKLPGLILKKGEPVGLDFKGLPAPKANGDLLRSIVRKGKGKTVTSSMTVTANYLGQVYGAKKPFDESYSKKPVPFALTGVIQGWTLGLSGVKVGSRVLLEIPSDLGYGAQKQANIPANSTLYFVVDIISAK